MDIQVVKISFSAEESAEALPVVLRTIAAAPASLSQGDFDVPAQLRQQTPVSKPEGTLTEGSARYSADLAAVAAETAPLADAQLASIGISQPAFQTPLPRSSVRSSAEPSNSPAVGEKASLQPSPPLKIAKPTGSLKKARTMILDEAQGCYRRRTLWDRVVGLCDRLDRWCETHSGIVVTLVGSSAGLGLLFLCIQLDVVERIHQRFFQDEAPVLVEPATEEDTDISPSDASEKSGQPKKLPLSEGAIK